MKQIGFNITIFPEQFSLKKTLTTATYTTVFLLEKKN